MSPPRHERVCVDVDVTPRFTACYLRVAGDECAFVEAHTGHAVPRLMAALATRGKRPEDVRYVVLTHAHLDHASGASALMTACPNATLLAHPRTAKHMVDPQKLIEGALMVYGEARFRELYGKVNPIPAGRVRQLGDGESFDLGGAKLTAWHTYGHAFHHFIVDDPALETVYTGDTFGLVYPALQEHGIFALPSTSPTGFHAAEARKSIDKVLSLNERWVCLTHFDAHEESARIAEQLRRFLDRAEVWVAEAARDADARGLQEQLEAAWWRAIDEEAPRLTAEQRALLQLDVELNAQGLVHAALAERSELARPQKTAEELARAWLAAFNTHDTEAVVALYAEHARHTSPKIRALHPETGGHIVGKDALRAWWNNAFVRLPQLRYELTALTADDRRACLEYRRVVPGEVDLPVAELFEIDNGLIVASRVYHG